MTLLDQAPADISNQMLEKNSAKARVGICISKKVEYKRIRHLEGVDSHVNQ